MNEGTKQIVIAVASAASAALVAGLVTHYFTKQQTIQSVASGATPLPPNATPTKATPTATTPTSSPSPAPSGGGQPSQESVNALVQAAGEQLGWIGASWKAMGYTTPQVSP